MIRIILIMEISEPAQESFSDVVGFVKKLPPAWDAVNMLKDGEIVPALQKIESSLLLETISGDVQTGFSQVISLVGKLEPAWGAVDLFKTGDFLRMMRMLDLYQVGRMPDGQPLKIPAHMLAAEYEDLEDPSS